MTTREDKTDSTRKKLPYLEPLAHLLVRRGLAESESEAAALVRDGKVVLKYSGSCSRDPQALCPFNSPIKILGAHMEPNTNVGEASKKEKRMQKSSPRTSVRTKKSSSQTRRSELILLRSPESMARRRTPSVFAIRQVELEELVVWKSKLERAVLEVERCEENLSKALAKGGRVQPGFHSAELRAERRATAGNSGDAGVIMKLVVL